MLFWGDILSNSLGHMVPVPLHPLAQAGLGRRPCSALDAVCTLPRLLVTLVSMVRNCLHVPLAAMDVRAL